MDSNSVSSKNVMEMLTVANEYCHFCEKAYQYPVDDILSYLQKIMPLLYLKGSLVPAVVVRNPEANERFVTEENYEIIFNELRNKFKPKDEFWLIENTQSTDNEPLKVSLAENLTDIYQDLKDFVLLYAKGTESAKENSVHDCKKFFENHWGVRLVQSQNYIHQLVYAGKIKHNQSLL